MVRSWGRIGAILGPSWAVLGPSWAMLELSWSRLGSSWAVLGPSSAVLGPSWGLLGPFWGGLGPNLAERRPQVGQDDPKMAQAGSKIAQDGAKFAPRWPKMAPREPKLAPRWAPKGPKTGPKAVQNRSSKAFQHRSPKRECAPQSQTPIWAVLGALLGPIWGRFWAPGVLLRRLETIQARNIKCSKYIVNYRSDWPSGGLSKDHVGVILRSNWHHKGVLTLLLISLATKVDLRGVAPFFGGVDPAPRAPGEGDLGGGIMDQ